jgi:Mannitol-1-phosphate/altronate dehydrogenases
MKMNLESLQDRKKWEEMGFKLPDYSVEKMIENTANNPEWIPFGAGNIFRAFPAVVCQHLFTSGIMTTGIVVAKGYDSDLLDKKFQILIILLLVLL